MHFRITGLPAEHFAHLFDLSDDALAERGVVRRIADDRTPGYPCRVSRRRYYSTDRQGERHARRRPPRVRRRICVHAALDGQDGIQLRGLRYGEI